MLYRFPMYTVDNIDLERVSANEKKLDAYSKLEMQQMCLDLSIPLLNKTTKSYAFMLQHYLTKDKRDKARFTAWFHGSDPYDIRQKDNKSHVENKEYSIIADDQKDIDPIVASIEMIKQEIAKNFTETKTKYYDLDTFCCYENHGLLRNSKDRIASRTLKAIKYFGCVKTKISHCPSYSKEEELQLVLEKYYIATHYTFSDGRVIDILTKTQIIEIKRWNKWRDAFPQVLKYVKDYELVSGKKLQPVVILFSKDDFPSNKKIKEAKELAKVTGITLGQFDGVEIIPIHDSFILS